jgi:SAM-dependent methyltransferase
MTATTDGWIDAAFFEGENGEPESVDGGTTNYGPLWHAISPRWGHSMHTMCSYHGMFPPRLAHYFIQRYSNEGDLVLDPFSGRGTTTLQARVEGRRTIGNDLNPLAYVLTRAKASPPSWESITGTIADLEASYNRQGHRQVEVPADIAMLYHEETLSQLVFLRSHLFRRPFSKWSRADFMIAGAVAGILHGSFRADGKTSAYLSISMPNTFSMSPAYVEKFIREKKLLKPQQNVFDRLRDKLARLYLDAQPGPPGLATHEDAIDFLKGRSVGEQSVDLLLTSPPYLQVVNYGQSNWIRLWWLGVDDVGRNAGAGRRRLDAKLDHQHNFTAYCDFMLRVLKGARRVLKPGGVAVFVIGDVATPGKEQSLALAKTVWDQVGASSGLRLVDTIEDTLDARNKVSRIWGETRGNATDRDCALVLARDDGDPRTDNPVMEWDENYKEGGPDAAYLHLRQRSWL